MCMNVFNINNDERMFGVLQRHFFTVIGKMVIKELLTDEYSILNNCALALSKLWISCALSRKIQGHTKLDYSNALKENNLHLLKYH